MIFTVLPSFLVLLAALLHGIASEEACGQRFFEDNLGAQSQGYIVGGTRAVKGSLPWQVSIMASATALY